MRGKVEVKARAAVAGRITPAHAGKRGKDKDGGAGGEDHPRPCGEK